MPRYCRRGYAKASRYAVSNTQSIRHVWRVVSVGGVREGFSVHSRVCAKRSAVALSTCTFLYHNFVANLSYVFSMQVINFSEMFFLTFNLLQR